MPATCWDKSLIINIWLVPSCWFLSLHPTFMMHGHKSLKVQIWSVQGHAAFPTAISTCVWTDQSPTTGYKATRQAGSDQRYRRDKIMSLYFPVTLFNIQEKLYSVKMVPIPTPPHPTPLHSTPLNRPVIQLYSTYCMNHGLVHSPVTYLRGSQNCSARLVTTPRDVYRRCRPKPTCIPALRNVLKCVIGHTYSLPLSPEKRNFLLGHWWRQELELGPPTPPSTPAP